MERLTVRAEECVESTYEPLVSVEWRAEQAKVKNKKNDLDLSGFGITRGFQGFTIFLSQEFVSRNLDSRDYLVKLRFFFTGFSQNPRNPQNFFWLSMKTQ